MHRSESPQATDEGIGSAWASRWYTLVAESSPNLCEEVSGRLERFTALLEMAGDARRLTPDPLTLTRTAAQAVDPLFTGLPIDVTQLLGFQALADVLAERVTTPAEALARWQALAFPWLHHPFFALTALNRLATQPDPAHVLNSLITELQTFVVPDSLRVWRYVNEDNPMIEIASSGRGRTVLLGERPDLGHAVHSGEPFVSGGLVIVPMQMGGAPFAVIEITAAVGELAAVLLRTLALTRLAEQALLHTNQPIQATNPATWQRVLTNLVQMLTVTNSAQDMLTTVSDHLRQALPCERIAFWEYQEGSEEFVLSMLSARLTTASQPLVGSCCPAEDSPLQVVWFTGKPLLLDGDWSQHFPGYPNTNKAINALAIIPLVFEYRCLGILTLERLEPRPFSRQDADWLMLVAGMVATALRNLEIHQTLKRAQERMMEDTKMRALGEMAAGITHDFNNILMALLSNVELLGFTRTLDEVHTRLPRLERAIHDARTIVNRVSAFGRMNEETEFAPVRLADILKDTAGLLDAQLSAAGVVTELSADPTIHALGNAAELREVLTNLLTNALHAMPQGGRLTLACGRQNGAAWFSVTDTGVGMPASVLAHACDPFFTTKDGVGSGLGLSVSYSIVQRHNGMLRLQSTEGTGTTVRIELPACPAPREAVAPVDDVHFSLHILLVEDHTEVADTLAQLLGCLGHQVIIAATAQEGIDWCERQPFDLVITDLSMRGDTGDAVAMAVRRLCPGAAVLLLSGSLDLEEECAQLYDAILRKPITLALLRQTISRVMGAGTKPTDLSGNKGGS